MGFISIFSLDLLHGSMLMFSLKVLLWLHVYSAIGWYIGYSLAPERTSRGTK